MQKNPQVNLRTSSQEEAAKQKRLATPSHHFPDHHDVGPQVLVDAEDVQQPDVPVDDVDAVDDSPVAPQGQVLQAENHPHGEQQDSYEVCNIPVLLQPNFDFLQQFPRFWHEDLEDRGNGEELSCLKVGEIYINR